MTFHHQNGALGQKELPETFASGVGLLDFNTDGLLDIYFVNGANLSSLKKETPAFFNRLYRNEGNLRFTDVTLAAGVQGKGYGMGVAATDYENDGFVDLYVTNFGQNQLFRNRGDGTFHDVTERSGLAGGGWSTSAAFFDFDRDGLLDLYVARYVEYQIGRKPFCGDRERRLLSYCLPDLFEPMADLLFRNNGDGTFTDVSQAAGIDKFKGRGLGLAIGDYNNDGWPDILVANDRTRNFLFQNNKDGTFQEVGLFKGVAYSSEGVARAGMGTDFGDFNGDGWLDILVTNFETEGLALFQNYGGEYFTDVAGRAGLYEPSYPYVGFGAKFLDYDNSGQLGILVVNGHTQDDISLYKPHITYPQPKLLFRNVGAKFCPILEKSAAALSTLKTSRGAAFGDLNDDGAVDVVVNNTNDQSEIMRNDWGRSQNAILLKLRGSRSNRDGIGTRLEVRIAGQTRVFEAQGAGSYLASNDLRVHVGLGSVDKIEEMKVRWPSGIKQRFGDLAARSIYVISELSGIVASHPLDY